MDSPHSERCAGTQIWAGHCRCYNSSLWTSLHPRRPQTSSSSETTQTHTAKHANMNMIKMQNGIKCQWTLQCVLEVHEPAWFIMTVQSKYVDPLCQNIHSWMILAPVLETMAWNFGSSLRMLLINKLWNIFLFFLFFFWTQTKTLL